MPSVPPEKSLTSRLYIALVICCVVFLSFVAGVVLHVYNLPPSSFIADSLTAVEAMNQQDQELSALSTTARTVDDALRESRITVNEPEAYQGYTLLSFRYSTNIYLIDMEGHIAHQWSMPFRKAWPHAPHVPKPVSPAGMYISKAHLFPNGDLIALYEAMGAYPYGYGLVKMDKDSNVIWTFDDHTHHDFYVEPETGNIFVLGQRPLTQRRKGLPFPMLEDLVIKLSPEGKEEWRIPVLDAFLGSPFEPMIYHTPKNPNIWDHFHTNSVTTLSPDIADKFPLFKAGDILISMRNMDALAVIDPTTQKVTWAYNGLIKAQHSPRFLPNGHILLLDNKGHVENGKVSSRLIELDPVRLGISWSYGNIGDQPFYSHAYGRSQRLINGNTIAIESYKGRVFEVTPEGKVVWSLVIPVINRDKLYLPQDPVKLINTNTDYALYQEIVDPHSAYSAIPLCATRYSADELDFLK